ncbi:hypothetical protein ED733_001250 [Metarhizium rileyi]|uniref:Cytochrome P450 n=1 Tax=Metarhizium rileyi (strain RCEF 4871) TaxID=1649241 RepID=A0A5C6FZ71_METRR|nr:hypothetical protein ED733_001250 [Metarhizium rileyi]
MELWGGALIICVASLLFSLAKTIHAFFLSPLRNVPGPFLAKITSLFVGFYDLRLQRNRKIYEWHQKYGKIILIAPGQVSVSSLSSTREIYSISGRHPKSTYFDHFSVLGARCIFTTRGCRDHQKMRKRTFQLYQPKSMYRPEIVQPIRELAQEVVQQLCAPANRSDKGEATINIWTQCNRYSFDNSTRLAMGPKHGSNAMRGTSDDSWMLDRWEETELWDNMAANLPLVHLFIKHIYRTVTGDQNFLSNDERLARWTTQQLHLALQETDVIPKHCLLGWLLEAKGEEGKGLSESEVGEEIIDNILAAMATVTLALTFSLWDLACHPALQHALREELRRLPSSSRDGLPTFESIINCEMLDNCIRETSRIHPLSSGHAERLVPVEKPYDGVMLPVGVNISASTLALHHNAEVFDEPFAYKPGRWKQTDPAHRSLMDKHYIPFGYGARFCLGSTFALVQIKTLVAFVILRLHLRQDPASQTSRYSMDQLDTQNALPRGLRCDVAIREI